MATDSRVDAEAVYQRDVASFDILTAAEERELFLAYEKAEVNWWIAILAHQPSLVKDLASQIADLGVLPPTRAVEDRERFAREIRLADNDRVLARAADEISGHPAAAEPFRREVKRLVDTIVSKNLRLVFLVVRKRFGSDRMDKVQNGNIGLTKAVGRFDVHRGFRFSTFALWWVRHHVTRGDDNTQSMIRTPVHARTRVTKIKKATAKFCTEYGRSPTHEELSTAVGESVETIAKAEEDARLGIVGSLDKPVGHEEGGTTVLDLMVDAHHEGADDTLDRERRMAKTLAVLAKLRSTLRPTDQVVLDRCVLGDDSTFSEVGIAVGLSRERIRQINVKLRARVQSALKFAFRNELGTDPDSKLESKLLDLDSKQKPKSNSELGRGPGDEEELIDGPHCPLCSKLLGDHLRSKRGDRCPGRETFFPVTLRVFRRSRKTEPNVYHDRPECFVDALRKQRERVQALKAIGSIPNEIDVARLVTTTAPKTCRWHRGYRPFG